MTKKVSVNDVTVTYEEHWAHIVTDNKLLGFLSQPGNGSMALARRILDEYERKFHKPLAISQASIAVEILFHAYLDVLSKQTRTIQELFPANLSQPLIKLMDDCHDHTKVIDSGELCVDNNRKVFDLLGEPVPRSLLMTALGILS